MDADVLWRALNWVGLEHASIQSDGGGGIVADVGAPSLDLRASDQRYSCIENGPEGGRYLYESGPFRAELTVP